MEKYDFAGWATRNNLLCSDGRTIMKDAFKECDGKTVPLVWNHQHNDPINVLGHALLENRDEGVYAYCSLNDTELGKTAKLQIQHGDINALSIYANKLKQQGSNVLHGAIREVSLVLAGANPGAFIDSVIMHGEEMEEDAIIYTGEDLQLAHADDDSDNSNGLAHADDKKEAGPVANEKKPDTADNKTVEDVLNTMTEEQKTVMYAMIGAALEGAEDDSDDNDDSKGGNDKMKHNVFDNDETTENNVLSHSAQEEILEIAKKAGSFQDALGYYAEENELQHDAIASGFAQENIHNLFPDYHDVRPGAPELITSDQGWISTVMNKVHKSPFSRIRTGQVDIRNIDALRAKGYPKKGAFKTLAGNYNLVRRTTDPQTVYVKSALHRDDIIDITDFDIVNYQYNIDKMAMDEELAMAIMLGDGRDEGDEYKIQEDKIRPIWTDDELYTIHAKIDLETAKQELQGTSTGTNFGENYIAAEAMINTVLYSREKYKGSGTPDMFITPHMLNVMLLARDMNGRRIYSSKAELTSALNVGNIYTVEQFEGKKRLDGKTSKNMELVAMIVNLADYSLGSTKGGQVTHFTQFDIDFNQQKSLLETRVSGALTRCWSAIAIEKQLD